MDMKLRGMYIARQLSFQGVTFKIEEVPLSNDYIRMYNKAVRLVRMDSMQWRDDLSTRKSQMSLFSRPFL